MRFLAIDYGLAHIGLAISDGFLAEPFGQLNFLSDDKLVGDISKICQDNQIKTILVGVSENQMAVKTRKFIKKLIKKINLPVKEVDETLSSRTAKDFMIKSGSSKKKRQHKDHQIAAAIILQTYLDNEVKMSL